MATQTERRAASRAALLESAAELIVERDFARAGVEQIGTRAGRSRGSVNYFFGSKAGLLEALIDETAVQYVQDAKRATAKLPADPDIIELLDALWWAWQTDPRRSRLAAMLLIETTAPGHDAGAQTAALISQAGEHIEALLKDHQSRGLVPSTLDTISFASALLTAALGLIAQQAIDANANVELAYSALTACLAPQLTSP